MHKLFSFFLIGVMLSSVLASAPMHNSFSIGQIFAQSPNSENKKQSCNALDKVEEKGNDKHLGIPKALENNECDPVKPLIEKYEQTLSLLGDYDDFSEQNILDAATVDLNELRNVVDELQDLGVIITIGLEQTNPVMGNVIFFDSETLNSYKIIIPNDTLPVLATLSIVEETAFVSQELTISQINEFFNIMILSVPNIIVSDDEELSLNFVLTSVCISLENAVTCATPSLFTGSNIEIDTSLSALSNISTMTPFLPPVNAQTTGNNFLRGLIYIFSTPAFEEILFDLGIDIVTSEVLGILLPTVTISGLTFNDLNFNHTSEVGEPRLPDWKFVISAIYFGQELPLFTCSSLTVCIPTDIDMTDSIGEFEFLEVQLPRTIEKIILTEEPTNIQLAQGWVNTTPLLQEIDVDFENLPTDNAFDDNEFGNRQEASVIVITQVTNDDQGVLQPSDFTNRVSAMTNAIPSVFDGQSSVSNGGVVVKLTPGVYDIIQDSVDGYDTQYSTGCSADENNPIQGGEFRTCIIDNFDIPLPATLIVIKKVINDEAGTSSPGDFTLHVTGNDPNPSEFLGVDGTLGTPGTPSTPGGILFQDNYSTNSGWTQVGSTITVNSPTFPGIVKFNNAFGGGGVNDQRVYRQLSSSLPTDSWIAELDYKFTASSLVHHYPLAFSSTSANVDLQSEALRITHGTGVNALLIGGGSGSASIPISTNAQYYLKLERTPTQLILSIFSDPARTIHVSGSPVFSGILATDYTNLNYIQHSNSIQSGSARTVTAEVDNTKIYVEDTSGTPEIPGTPTIGGVIVTLQPGPFTVSEDPPITYTVRYENECSGTIASGETKTCVVINEDRPEIIPVVFEENFDDGDLNGWIQGTCFGGTCFTSTTTSSVAGPPPSEPFWGVIGIVDSSPSFNCNNFGQLTYQRTFDVVIPGDYNMKAHISVFHTNNVVTSLTMPGVHFSERGSNTLPDYLRIIDETVHLNPGTYPITLGMEFTGICAGTITSTYDDISVTLIE